MNTTAEDEAALVELAADYWADPLGWVEVAYPWGVVGGPLEHHKGPCSCQRRILTILGEEIRKRNFDGHTPVAPIKIAVRSGHGIGKSSGAGMIVDFLTSTRPGCRGKVTANTESQLKGTTWASIRWWKSLSVTSHWFESTTEKIYKKNDQDDWFVQAQVATEEKPEAFAGQHAASSTSFYLNDEASAIFDVIFPYQDGGMTDGEPMQFLFGNPTRPSGKFARIFDGLERGYIAITIDSRECELTNKQEIAEMIKEHGEDSDYVRVRVLGLPPRAGIAQYFDDDLLKACRTRPLPHTLRDEPLTCGVDFSWGGEDLTSIRFLCGKDARSIPMIAIPGEKCRGPEGEEFLIAKLAGVLDKDYDGRRIHTMFCDGSGIAGAVVPRLRQLGYRNIIEVNFSAHSVDPSCLNNRSMMIKRLKQAMVDGLAIDTSPLLYDDCRFIGIEKHIPLQFESKDKLRSPRRLGRSTDNLDSLALNYYMKVVAASVKRARAKRNYRARNFTPTAYS